MTKIHYFQRYSQKENVVTNNTLLLFSRLYYYSPARFNEFLNQLFEGEPQLKVGVQFEQQLPGLGSVPDGKVFQESFCLLIETKLDGNFSIGQIADHIASFGDERTRVLLMLSPVEARVDEKIIKQPGLYVKALTFERVIKAVQDVLTERDYEMETIIEDYADFCSQQNLLSIGKYTLRIVPCGISIEANFSFNMYYAPADRTFREFDYLGIYKDKNVQGIGKVQKIIKVNIEKMEFESVKGKVDAGDKVAIKKMVAFVQEKYGHCLSGEDVCFFVVDQFHKTKFRKETSGGIFNHRYFDLRNFIKDYVESEDSKAIAEALEGKTWS